MADEGRAVAVETTRVRRGHDDLHASTRRSPPSRTATTSTSLQYTARQINPFLVKSGLTQKKASLKGLSCPSSRRPTSDRSQLRERGDTPPAGAPSRPSTDRRTAAAPPEAAPRTGAVARHRARDAARGRTPARAVAAARRDPAAGARRCSRSPASPACSRLWWFAATVWSTNTVARPDARPRPGDAGVDYWNSGELGTDFAASATRVLIGYAISMGVGIVLGLAIGSFRSVESFCEPPIGFLRYIPATALTPLFLLWLGIDETPEDRAHHRGHRLLQHPDDRRRRARRPARAHRHLVHARRRTTARAAAGHLPALVARHRRRRPHQPRGRVADARRRRAARGAGRPRLSPGRSRSASARSTACSRSSSIFGVDRCRSATCLPRFAQPRSHRGLGHDSVDRAGAAEAGDRRTS